MANTAHCAFCFETLAADLENRDSLDLFTVLDLWSRFEIEKSPAAADHDAIIPHQESYKYDGTTSAQPQVEATEEESVDVPTESNDDDHIAQPKPTSFSGGLRLPSISRLQAPSPASSSSSSSTPSSLSTSSSTAALGDNSKSSSNSSFFSLGRSKQPSPTGVSREEEHPLFVTWNTVSARSGHKSLRGCIGTFDPHKLSNGLRSYALTAAFDDTRFPPISLSELPTLSTSVTLLTGFTPCAHPFDWEIGTHGIRISFSHHSKRYGATYLPDVAVEQGWSKEECLISLMRKAGWSGRRGEWKDVKNLNVVKYQGQKSTLDYAEWKEWRDCVGGR